MRSWSGCLGESRHHLWAVPEPNITADPSLVRHGTFSKLARCAIYTRKSTEHNLDLAFTSLDAQREACEAYILPLPRSMPNARPVRHI